MAQSEMAFNLLRSDDLKSLVIKISKVMTEVWLYKRTGNGTKYPDGKAFLEGLAEGDTVSQILTSLRINIPAETFIKPVLNTTSINGGIIVDPTVEDSATKPVRFLWEIPFFPDPTAATVTNETLDKWVNDCNQWLDNPTPNLPVPQSMYIPLSTS